MLKKLATMITKLIPMDASAIRYGGEEFLIVLPDKNTKEASEIANKIRKKVETDLKIKGIKNKITISGGVKEYNEALTKVTLIEAADKNLYTAKQNGRNKVVI